MFQSNDNVNACLRFAIKILKIIKSSSFKFKCYLRFLHTYMHACIQSYMYIKGVLFRTSDGYNRARCVNISSPFLFRCVQQKKNTISFGKHSAIHIWAISLNFGIFSIENNRLGRQTYCDRLGFLNNREKSFKGQSHFNGIHKNHLAIESDTKIWLKNSSYSLDLSYNTKCLSRIYCLALVQTVCEIAGKNFKICHS